MKNGIVTECINCPEVRDSLQDIKDFLVEHETKDKLTEEDLDWIEVEMKRLISFFV